MKKGDNYNLLTAIRYNRSDGKHSYWLFRCECGQEKVIRTDQVKFGHTKSCGCLMEKQDYTNRTCEIEGCDNLGIKLKSGQRGRLCTKHRRMKQGKYGNSNGGRTKEVEELKLKPCSMCGWDKTINDVHRVVAGKDGGKYEVDNCITLCPNCHRLLHLGRRTKTELEVIV